MAKPPPPRPKRTLASYAPTIGLLTALVGLVGTIITLLITTGICDPGDDDDDPSATPTPTPTATRTVEPTDALGTADATPSDGPTATATPPATTDGPTATATPSDVGPLDISGLWTKGSGTFEFKPKSGNPNLYDFTERNNIGDIRSDGEATLEGQTVHLVGLDNFFGAYTADLELRDADTMTGDQLFDPGMFPMTLRRQ